MLVSAKMTASRADPSTPAIGLSAMPLSHREHGGVQADAEREDADDGEREGRVLRERTDRVADVAHVDRARPRATTASRLGGPLRSSA